MRSQVVNWIARPNPFALLAPPDWWLRRLWERDQALRIMPGLKEACYRIGRRSLAMARVTPILGNDSETGRMCRERCVPVVSLRPGVVWNDDFFTWLDQHDTWLAGGPTQFVDRLERQEADAAERLQRETDDEADRRSDSAYFARLVRDGAVAFLSSAHQDGGQSGQVPAPDSGD